MQKAFSTKLSPLLIAVLLLGTIPSVLPSALAQEPSPEDINQLNEEIRQKRERISEIDSQIKSYEAQIEAKEDEVASLSGELSVIENQIAITNLTIQSAQEKIETMGLEIEKATADIDEHQVSIEKQKGTMGDLLRQLYRYDQQTLLEVTLSYDRFSTYFDTLNNLSTLETKLKAEVDAIEVLKHELEIRREDLQGKQHELETERAALESSRKNLDEQQVYQAVLLDQATGEKSQIEGSLEELKGEQSNINGEITSLEEEFRKKLDGSDIYPVLGDAILMWPVPPRRGISAYFHDPSYPFRRVFEHPAIDVPTPQGTPIAAAEDGVVAIARRRDWIRNAQGQIIAPAYNYVTLIHGNSISTVYGHLSAVNVVEGSFVRKGSIIGLSGATPGTAGAGRLTTGPHLHFEVRVNGIPDDPLHYLPAL